MNKRQQTLDELVNKTSNDIPMEASHNRQVGDSSDVQQTNDQDRDRTKVENQVNSGTTPRLKSRIEALDALRGLTITGMIFVNYGGAGYSFLQHKPWNGLALADLVFPYFIFAMGASIAISTTVLVERQRRPFGEIASMILVRSLILTLLGLFLNLKSLNYNNLSLASLRVTGVLQRFGISYLVVALMYAVEYSILNKWIKAQSIPHVPILSKVIGTTFEILTAINYLAIYVYVTFFFEYDSNCPVGYLGPGGLTEGGRYANCTGGAAAWLDREVLGDNHLYHDREVKQVFQTQVSHDPEGILGYTTSILLTLIGLQCGKTLIKQPQAPGLSIHRQRLIEFSQWIVLLSISCSLVVIIPVNKRLWSLTLVPTTALGAFVTILILYVILDVYQCNKLFLARIIISAGKNSIFLFIGHSLLSGFMVWVFPVNEASHLQLLIRLTWATFVWLLAAKYMEMKGILMKV